VPSIEVADEVLSAVLGGLADTASGGEVVLALNRDCCCCVGEKNACHCDGL
jgi:hypothetical protein